MAHKMALAEIDLKGVTIYDNYTYTYTSVSNQGTPIQTGGNIWYASSTMSSTYKPYRHSDTKAYFIRKPGAAAFTVSATQSNIFATYKSNKRYAWSASIPATSPASTYTSTAVSYSGPPYLQATWNIPCYSGIVSYITPYAGKYEFMCWGANGGNGYSTYYWTGSGYREANSTEKGDGSCYCYGGKGGYTYGVLSSLASNVVFFVCVGGAGNNSSTVHLETNGTFANAQKVISGGYNGGGNGSEWNNTNVYVHNGGGGGGATHIATATGLLASLSKNQVLMVAGGGGGGGGHEAKDTGGNAGGTTGSSGAKLGNGGGELALGGTQVSGGAWANGVDYSIQASKGQYGFGGSHLSGEMGGGGGGGAGYYGGAGNYWHGGGGGSSYINGYAGCTQQNTTYIFTGTSMIAGANVASQAANPSGNNNGYCRITFTYIP